jgi:hypothetical protein
MTTNHPEKLDPALVRPGRINKKMLLGYLHLPEAEAMVEHYFGKMTDRQRARMDHLFTPNVFTPAQVSDPSAPIGAAHVAGAPRGCMQQIHKHGVSALYTPAPPYDYHLALILSPSHPPLAGAPRGCMQQTHKHGAPALYTPAPAYDYHLALILSPSHPPLFISATYP